jgi:hypothetical protein
MFNIQYWKIIELIEHLLFSLLCSIFPFFFLSDLKAVKLNATSFDKNLWQFIICIIFGFTCGFESWMVLHSQCIICIFDFLKVHGNFGFLKLDHLYFHISWSNIKSFIFITYPPFDIPLSLKFQYHIHNFNLCYDNC